MGFASKDCTFPDASPGSLASLAASVSFYDMGLVPAGVCMPLDAAFAILFKKSAYTMTVLSDGAIFGIFIAACLLALALYVLSMYVRKVGPYSPDGSWADYLLNLKAASVAAAAAAQKAAAAAAQKATTTTDKSAPGAAASKDPAAANKNEAAASKGEAATSGDKVMHTNPMGAPAASLAVQVAAEDAVNKAASTGVAPS